MRDATAGPDGSDAQLVRLAALAEPVRRLLYRFVAAQDHPVSRDQAAAGVAVARHVAKFHLDRLESEGLLEVEYRRPAGRGGPGAGRPTKLYRRSRREFAVTLPERQYELAGQLMAAAISRSASSGGPVADALQTAARDAGAGWAASSATSFEPDRPGQAVQAACAALQDHGYEPVIAEDTQIKLRNCPFHRLAEQYRALVCGMNLALIDGLATGLADGLDLKGRNPLRPRLDPGPGRCCVMIGTQPVAGGSR